MPLCLEWWVGKDMRSGHGVWGELRCVLYIILLQLYAPMVTHNGHNVHRNLLLLDEDVVLRQCETTTTCRDVHESLSSSRVLIFKYWHDATEALDAVRWLLFVSRCVLFEVK